MWGAVILYVNHSLQHYFSNSMRVHCYADRPDGGWIPGCKSRPRPRQVESQTQARGPEKASEGLVRWTQLNPLQPRPPPLPPISMLESQLSVIRPQSPSQRVWGSRSQLSVIRPHSPSQRVWGSRVTPTANIEIEGVRGRSLVVGFDPPQRKTAEKEASQTSSLQTCSAKSCKLQETCKDLQKFRGLLPATGRRAQLCSALPFLARHRPATLRSLLDRRRCVDHKTHPPTQTATLRFLLPLGPSPTGFISDFCADSRTSKAARLFSICCALTFCMTLHKVLCLCEQTALFKQQEGWPAR